MQNPKALFSGWIGRVWTRLPPARIRTRKTAFSRLLTDTFGRELLSDLALYCNARNASFVPGDPQATAFNEGQRDAFLHILELAQLSDASLALILEETDPR